MTHVDWKPYPENKPKVSCDYLVTFKFKRLGLRFVGTALYSTTKKRFFPNPLLSVLAWAELPEPYKKGGRR